MFYDILKQEESAIVVGALSWAASKCDLKVFLSIILSDNEPIMGT